MATPHINSAALAHELARHPRGFKSQVARDAVITPGHLSDLETGRRFGTRSPELFDRLADALNVDVAVITCWCDRPDSLCRSVTQQEGAA